MVVDVIAVKKKNILNNFGQTYDPDMCRDIIIRTPCHKLYKNLYLEVIFCVNYSIKLKKPSLLLVI